MLAVRTTQTQSEPFKQQFWHNYCDHYNYLRCIVIQRLLWIIQHSFDSLFGHPFNQFCVHVFNTLCDHSLWSHSTHCVITHSSHFQPFISSYSPIPLFLVYIPMQSTSVACSIVHAFHHRMLIYSPHMQVITHWVIVHSLIPLMACIFSWPHVRSLFNK